MSDIQILAVPMTTEIPETTLAILAEKGVAVIRSASPELVRLVTPSDSLEILPSNEFLWAAVDALSMSSEQYSQPDADKLRRKFVTNLNEVATKKRRKLIGWSSEQAALSPIEKGE